MASTLQDILRQRRLAVGWNPNVIGLDSVLVEECSPDRTRFRLLLRFIPPDPGVTKDAIPPELSAANIEIVADGVATFVRTFVRAESRTAVVLDVTAVPEVESPGPDWNPLFTVRLVRVPQADPYFDSLHFQLSSKALDSGAERGGLTEATDIERPFIDYLAKDYESFRGLMLDRMAQEVPGWQERNPSDLGVAIVEVLAYAADYLSYYQDAISTEAYLDTARRRISVRRLARLVDYRLNEGCNARVWVQVLASVPNVVVPQGTAFLTGPPEKWLTSPEELERAAKSGAAVFESMYPVTCFPEHNRIEIYTWGADEFVAPAGATSVTLSGRLERLRRGDVLIFEEVINPLDGTSESARSSYRHAVRLNERPRTGWDELYGAPITEVTWHDDDALPFDLTVTTRIGARKLTAAAIVRGNIVLADAGRTVYEALPAVGVANRYSPRLADEGVVHRDGATPGELRERSAASSVHQNPGDALADVELIEHRSGAGLAAIQRWWSRPDLLESYPFSPDFVVELDNQGISWLRFGDGKTGLRPKPGALFTARYRAAKREAEDVGPERLTRVQSGDGRIGGVRNPLAARGARPRESLDAARIAAPEAFRRQRRLVTLGDYQTLLRGFREIRGLALERSWTGSWWTEFLYVQLREGKVLDEGLSDDMLAALAPYRLLGRDMTLRRPRYVALDIEVQVSVIPAISASLVHHRLRERFRADLPEGFFWADRFSFGQPLSASEILQAVAGVPGVASARMVRFGKWGKPVPESSPAGSVSMGRYEILRVDNDPVRTSNGQIRFRVPNGAAGEAEA